jgi:hypothetical protein
MKNHDSADLIEGGQNPLTSRSSMNFSAFVD